MLYFLAKPLKTEIKIAILLSKLILQIKQIFRSIHIYRVTAAKKNIGFFAHPKLSYYRISWCLTSKETGWQGFLTD